MTTSVLIVEDEPSILELISYTCRTSGMEVRKAANVAEAKKNLEAAKPDIILLDWMLPDCAGLEWLYELRRYHSNESLPVIMLTARGQEDDRVRGLEAGADDYVTKPFSPAELTARIDALYRRIGGEPNASPDELSQGPFVLNTRNRTLEKAGQKIRLTQVEYAIVKLFMQNPGRAMSREDILAAVWGRDYDGELKIVDVNIRRLRIKIEDDTSNPVFITTVWGYGYKWGA